MSIIFKNPAPFVGGDWTYKLVKIHNTYKQAHITNPNAQLSIDQQLGGKV